VFQYSHSAAPCLNLISGATSKHSSYSMQFTSLYYLASLPTAFFRTPEHTCLIVERAEMRHIESSHTASHPILIVELPTLRGPARRTSGPCTRLLSIGAQMQTSYSTVVSRLIWTKYSASVGELLHPQNKNNTAVPPTKCQPHPSPYKNFPQPQLQTSTNTSDKSSNIL
jgi:hypothetical protein